VQVGLFSELRRRHLLGHGGAGGGASSVGLIACCAHHLAQLAPFVGATGAAVFLTDYRIPFMVIGIGGNALGIAIIASRLRRAQRENPPPPPRGGKRVCRSLIIAAISSAAVVTAGCGGGAPAAAPPVARLDTRTDSAGDVEIRIEPRQLDETGAVFKVVLDTHSGDLSADLEAATLEFGGKIWQSAEWSGDGPGGHHREGELRFSPTDDVAGSVILTVISSPNRSTRLGSWATEVSLPLSLRSSGVPPREASASPLSVGRHRTVDGRKHPKPACGFDELIPANPQSGTAPPNQVSTPGPTPRADHHAAILSTGTQGR